MSMSENRMQDVYLLDFKIKSVLFGECEIVRPMALSGLLSGFYPGKSFAFLNNCLAITSCAFCVIIHNFGTKIKMAL